MTKKLMRERQALVLSAYCEHQNYNYILIQDLGSGLNYKKKGLKKLIDLILIEEVDRLIITNKDRLLRFGSELIFGLCEHLLFESLRERGGSYYPSGRKKMLRLRKT
jgi:putative resolvase